MSPADHLRALADLRWTDEDGDAHTMRLAPPLAPAELAALEARLDGPLPATARAMLAVGRGLDDTPLGAIDFAGALDDMIEAELLPDALPIAGDGYGNFWLVERRPGAEGWGPVWYAAHDPPVIAWQGPDVADFLAALRERAEPPHRGPLHAVRETASARIWREQPGAIGQREAARASDPVLRAFAESLDADWWVVDLRAAERGDGVAWGHFGPRTLLRRAGDAAIVAYGPPPAQPSWWRRLLGGAGGDG